MTTEQQEAVDAYREALAATRRARGRALDVSQLQRAARLELDDANTNEQRKADALLALFGD